MFKKLRNKMLIFNMSLLSLVMIAAFITIYFITYANIRTENQKKLQNIPSFTSTIGIGRNIISGPAIDSNIFQGISLEYDLSFVIFTSSNKEIVSVSSYLDLTFEQYQEIYDKIKKKEKTYGDVSFAGKNWIYNLTPRAYFPPPGQGFHLSEIENKIVFLDVTNSYKTLKQLLITFTIIGLLMLGVLFAVCFYFANRSIKPLELNWQKQKQFIGDASHELKTPLAIIRSNMEAIESSGEESVNSQKEWIGYIHSELTRMGKLIGDLLYLVKSDNLKENQLLPMDLSIITQKAIASMEALIYEKNLNLQEDIEEGIIIHGDHEKFMQAILILLDNAIKYTENNGDILISLEKFKGYAIFKIKNNSQEIPPKDLEKIFDRFYRPDGSRSHETGGYGLGLSIAKAIVERSNGIISAESRNGFTSFSISVKAIN